MDIKSNNFMSIFCQLFKTAPITLAVCDASAINFNINLISFLFY